MLTQSSNLLSSSSSSLANNEVPRSTFAGVATALFSALIASLPFFSVRNATLILSPPLLILLLIIATVLLRSILTLRLRFSVSKFDIGVLVYLAVVSINLSTVANADGAQYAFIKTLTYVCTYFCLKQMLQDLSLDSIASSVKNGVFIGSCLFLATALVCLVLTGQIYAITKFDYYSLTKSTFASIDAIVGSGQPDDFEGRDVMRNAVAEAFTLYFLSTLVFKFQSRVANIFILVLNISFVICTFSRRAFHAIAIVIFGGSVFDQAGLKRGLSMALLVGSIVLGSLFLHEESGENRLADLSDGGRSQQYFDALDQFSGSPWHGVGFGSKLERGSYVHNFVLGSAAMMGVAGLFAALYIYVLTIIQFLIGLAKPRVYNTATFLVIPILGMTVGATFEGLFTITSWIAFSLFSHCSNQPANIERKYAEASSGALHSQQHSGLQAR